MIRINLLAERKPVKAKAPGVRTTTPGAGGGQNVLLSGVLLLGIVVAGGWWWIQDRELKRWNARIVEANAELERLKEIRAKGDSFKRQGDLLKRKIQLITDLKKKQSVPVHILDEVSKNLPDFLWLDSMDAVQNQISITGKATTYNAVSNFYDNLSSSGYFTGVDLGKTSEAVEGVSFSLSFKFVAGSNTQARPQG